MHGLHERIPSKINRQILPGRLIDRTESSLRGGANVRADLRLGVHKILITSRGEIGAEPLKVLGEKSPVADFGIQLKDMTYDLKMQIARGKLLAKVIADRKTLVSMHYCRAPNCALWLDAFAPCRRCLVSIRSFAS